MPTNRFLKKSPCTLEQSPLVLDLNCRCEDTKEVCYKLIEPAMFLDRARQANMLIVYPAANSG